MEAKNYTSLSIAVDDMQKRGFTKSFVKEEYDSLIPEDWEVMETYRFEGMSSTDDNSIVYGIRHKISHIKAIIIDAYGVYSNEVIGKFISKVENAGQ